MSLEEKRNCTVAAGEHLSERELILQLEAAKEAVEVGAVYAHYRDLQNRYRVVGLAIIEATQEPGVLYQKESGSAALKSIVWVRPLASWLDKVDVDGSPIPRFQKVSC